MPRQVTRIPPGVRRFLQFASVAFIAVGLTLFVLGIVDFLRVFGEIDVPFAEPRMPEVWMIFLGIGLAVVGGYLSHFAFLKPISEIVATETEGAVEITGSALGRGLQSSFGPVRTPEVVKIKCRACGYLETEDAKFCSHCRAPL